MTTKRVWAVGRAVMVNGVRHESVAQASEKTGIPCAAIVEGCGLPERRLSVRVRGRKRVHYRAAWVDAGAGLPDGSSAA